MLAPPKTTGPGKTVRFKRRKQKRLPRRLLEAVPADWERWDAAARAAGLNWSEFTRRALNAAVGTEVQQATRLERKTMDLASRFLSQKPTAKNGAAAAKKTRPAKAARKGTSRTKGAS
jgi:hypothetical protein